MIHLLAQAASQPAVPTAAWKTWTAQDWVLLIGAIGAAVATVLAAWAKYQASIAEKKADKAQDSSQAATVKAAQAKTAAYANTEHAIEARRELSQIQQAMPGTPAAPSPEAQAKAFDAANTPEKPPC